MAIPNLKTKLKQNLKKDIEAEKAGGNKSDKRFLNYFDLKFDEKMTVLFVPDVNGEFWTKFSKHGPNLKTTGADKKERGVRVDHINCARISSGDDCPVCQKGFDLYALAKETGDKSHKDFAKLWMPRDYTLVSCIVIESPMDIIADDIDNQVKLMYLPYGIENVIKEQIAEGLISEDELCSTPFIIKQTENSGGKASYNNSYFARKMITDDELAYLADMTVEQYDYTTLDVIPKNTTTDDMDIWLALAEEAYEKALNGANRAAAGAESTNAAGAGVPKQESRLANLRNQAAAATSQAPAEDQASDAQESDAEDSASFVAESDAPEADAPQDDAPKSDVRSRLDSLRRK